MKPMLLADGDIILRDRIPADLADHRRWLTTETAWLEWDAPWENNDPAFVHDYLERMEQRLGQPLPPVRSTMEICHRDGAHVGMVNAYYIDGDAGMLAAGITLRESRYWGRGLGSQAFTLWLAYIFHATGRERLYCQTWSGNQRMLKLAERTGFSEFNRIRDAREVQSRRYDALTFVLCRELFQAAHPDLRW